MKRFLTALCTFSLVACSTNSSDNLENIAPRFTSTTTFIDLEECDVLTTYEQGNGAELLCRGLNDIPVYITEGDLRMDVDIGVKNDQWASLDSFNTISPEFEWRLFDGEPAAAIVRYIVDGMPEDIAGLNDVFALVLIGREGQPGCTKMYPKADDAREAVLDQNLANFCS